jgi:hypothetical protein
MIHQKGCKSFEQPNWNENPKEVQKLYKKRPPLGRRKREKNERNKKKRGRKRTKKKIKLKEKKNKKKGERKE